MLPERDGRCRGCGRKSTSHNLFCSQTERCRASMRKVRAMVAAHDCTVHGLPSAIPGEVAGGPNARGRWAVPPMGVFAAYYRRTAPAGRFTSAQLGRAAWRLRGLVKLAAWEWSERAVYRRRVLSCPADLWRLRPPRLGVARFVRLAIGARYHDRQVREWRRRLGEAGPLALIDTRGSHHNRRRATPNARLWRRLVTLVARGSTIARAWRRVTPVARRLSVPWLALRTAQVRLMPRVGLLRQNRATLAAGRPVLRGRAPRRRAQGGRA